MITIDYIGRGGLEKANTRTAPLQGEGLWLWLLAFKTCDR